ncbi:peptidase inhibitor family I36 protein [Streptomyces sp. NPDC051567]|uniref:peptidase inhibitor family I36 protein n=1 Tax=Streptomyces sp. NPDC051567 TaxID=3365660 RepID=UPI0037924B8E
MSVLDHALFGYVGTIHLGSVLGGEGGGKQWPTDHGDQDNQMATATYFYKDANLSGHRLQLDHNPGSYDLAHHRVDLSDFDNAISSVSVSSQHRVTVYTGANFTGDHQVLDGPHGEERLQGWKNYKLNETFNDTVSSFKIERVNVFTGQPV